MREHPITHSTVTTQYTKSYDMHVIHIVYDILYKSLRKNGSLAFMNHSYVHVQLAINLSYIIGNDSKLYDINDLLVRNEIRVLTAIT